MVGAGIANAIRAKTGENGTMTAEEMPAKIESIETGITPSGSLNITANGDNIGVTTKATVNVNVPNPSTGTTYITTNGTHNVTNYAYADVSIDTCSVLTIQDAGVTIRYAIEDTTGRNSNRTINQKFVSDSDALTNIADYEINASETVPWNNNSENIRIDVICGGHLSETYYFDYNCLVLGALVKEETSEQPITLNLHLKYQEYDAEYSESELNEMWYNYLSNHTIYVYDMSGRCMGYLIPGTIDITTSDTS